ncbi:MAG: hypothetical protein HYY20_11395 [Candidatus Tectomicrobia bacterium]|uniref:Uncharacterized protein n=1 Tax=Tectimicrobiota bacterium TaxID=2528274 RepID=A0A932CRW2_UNCTE|nr:hypothetical protein [Candidatus Tectomicrobia bacterium]
MAAFGAAPARSDINININIGPPPIVVEEPVEVVVVPESRVYFVPDPELDVFFCDGYWYSPRGSRWYRARSYGGPWVVVKRRLVPVEVVRVPSNYREIYLQERHIPYGQWKKEQKHWEKEQRKHAKEHRKEHKKHEKEHKHGRGHGHNGD